jgi:hypothetical protein
MLSYSDRGALPWGDAIRHGKAVGPLMTNGFVLFHFLGTPAGLIAPMSSDDCNPLRLAGANLAVPRRFGLTL